MGYTHYWRRIPQLDPGQFAAAALDCGTIAAKIPVRLAGSDGKGRPDFAPALVAFNGPEDCGHPDRDYGIAWPAKGAGGVVPHGFADASGGSWFAGATITARACGGDCSHESFVLEPTEAPIVHPRAPMIFGFCKTAFKPYDLAVQACLIVFTCRFPGAFLVTSDGDAELWTEAAAFVQEHLGYGADFHLATKAETDAADLEPPPPPEPRTSIRYMTAAETAADIRAVYKRHGWTSRMVSVRAENYAGGSSVSVTLKDPRVPLGQATNIAKSRESIRRDGWGEILSGGNRYISIRETEERERALAEPFIPAVEAAIARQIARGQSSICEPVEGTEAMISFGQHGQEWQLWIKDQHSLRVWHHPTAAASMALRIAHAQPSQGDPMRG